MAHLCINPEGIDAPNNYTHVIIARGSRMVFIAGQYPEDPSGKLVGKGDMAKQAAQAFANLDLALRAAGAKPEDVTRLGIYVAKYKHEYLAMIDPGRRAVFGNHHPTDVLVGVETLAYPEYLIEVEAIAVIPDDAAP
ncbi:MULTISPECIES: RidA family protein [unclassified Mesorhizobium]|uniref:RidA family protein n=1 Tax=unclassified Mesorhizobium TaxID=325217 RepID=UPI00067E67B0|nr:RidA family protein [Mesorhizobium sp. L2C085B000]